MNLRSIKLIYWLLLGSSVAAGATLVETIQAGRLDESRRKVVRPSEIYAELSSLPGAAQRKTALLKALSTHIQSSLSAETQREILAQLEIDRFPTVALERIPLIQEAIYLSHDAATLSVTPAPPLRSVTFQLGAQCTPPKLTQVPKVRELYTFQTLDPIDQAVEPCFAANSASLSNALNHLAESRKRLTVVFTSTQGQKTYDISSYRDLLHALGEQGFSVEIFIKRTLVDFFGDTFNAPGKAPRDVRLVLWVSVPLPDGRRLSVPAEHGDYGILLTRDGKKRTAESRYFIGVPSPGQLGVSFWRPRAVKNQAWTASRLEYVEAFEPKQTQGALNWLEASASTLRAFSKIQTDYAFPASAYGYYVCNDSVALALAKFSEFTGKAIRISHLFPLMRVTTLESLSENGREIEDDFAKALRLKKDFVRQIYPSDPILAEDPDALKQRLLHAFPASDKDRFGYFPETVKEFEDKLWQSPPLLDARP